MPKSNPVVVTKERQIPKIFGIREYFPAPVFWLVKFSAVWWKEFIAT